MSDHCWYNLSINVKNCFLKDFKFPAITGRYGVWHLNAKNVFNAEWLMYMKSIGLPIASVMIFYRDSYAHTAQAHIDISKVEPFAVTNFGINWCYGGDNSEMIWYRTPAEGYKVQHTKAYTPYAAWDRSSLTEIERVHLGEQVSIVRTGIPHSIIMGEDPRWAFSARCSLLDNLEWEDILQILQDKNLIIER